MRTLACPPPRFAAAGIFVASVLAACSEGSPVASTRHFDGTDGGETAETGAPSSPPPARADAASSAEAGTCPPRVLRQNESLPPGLEERITEIQGTLDLAGRSASMVSRFVCLRKVTGDVRIGNRVGSPSISLPNLEGSIVKSLAGLEKLEFIGGNLTLSWNPELESLAALGALRSVGGTLKIDGSPKLRDLHGLEGITSLGEMVISLPTLDSLQGLRNLQAVEHDVAFYLSKSTGGLRSLAELASLERIGGNFILQYSSLESVALLSLKSVGGYVSVHANTGLATLGFGALERIDGALTLESNPELAELSGLESITHLENLRIGDNDALTTLSAFANLETITGDLTVESNPALTSLGLAGLSSVAGQFAVSHNAELPACAPAELAQKIGARCPVAPYCDAECRCQGNDGTGTCQ